MSALFDTVGLIPFVGEVGDTAKLARIGANAIYAASDARRAIKAGTEVIENADDIADFAKHTDDVYDVLKNTDDIAEDIYSARKVDGTIKGHLDSVEDPIKEMEKLSKSIAKTSPIKIPDDAMIDPQIKNGYYQIKYKWQTTDGYNYEARWHTKTPNAPSYQNDSWVISRKVPGIGYGPNHRNGYTDVLTFDNGWVDSGIWEDAISARNNKIIDEKLEDILDYGHHKA